MSTETLLLISIPTLLVGLIIWFAAKSEKPHESVESDDDDQRLFDPVTGQSMTVAEAEAGYEISEEHEKAFLEDVNFEEVTDEKNKSNVPAQDSTAYEPETLLDESMTDYTNENDTSPEDSGSDSGSNE